MQTKPPPIKRRRLSLFCSEPTGTSHTLVYNHKRNPTIINQSNDKLKKEFKSQLQQLLLSFPPLIDIITMENNQNQIIHDLFNIFISTDDPHSETNPLLSQKHQRKTDITKPKQVIIETNQIITPQSTCARDTTSITCNRYEIQSTNVRSKNINYHIPANVLVSVKQKEIARIRHRVSMRAEKLVYVINETITKYMKQIDNNTHKQFIIDTDTKNRITNQIINKLEQWKGGTYNAKLLNEKDCYKKTRQYWNRQKAQVLGNSLFGPILCMACQFVVDNTKLNVNTHQRLLLFIEIYQHLCEATIQFDRAMARPLILNASYLKQNQWKVCCFAFIKFFGIMDNCSKINEDMMCSNRGSNAYIRAQCLHDEFQKMLKNIKIQLLKCRDIDFMQKTIESYLSCIQGCREMW
eukprot:354907_1